jgi:hypothetical protein
MNKNKRVVAGCCLTGLALLCLAPGPQAAADPGAQDRSSTAIAKANPQISEDLLNSLPTSILGNSGIWVDPSIPPGTAFLQAGKDGTLRVADGQTAEQQKVAKRSLDEGPVAAAACRTSVVVPVGVTNLVVKSSCTAVIGANDSAKVTYTVSNGDTSGTATFQPEGYKKTQVCVTKPPLLPVCHYEWKAYWAVGQPAPGHATVTWGQVAAMPRVRFSNAGIIGWNGYFVP